MKLEVERGDSLLLVKLGLRFAPHRHPSCHPAVGLVLWLLWWWS
jgi:hypothetical protein